jgi:putative addiction module killer protein
MIEVRQTGDFAKWLNALSDDRAFARITRRLVTVAAGSLGDAKFFEGIGEFRIDYGPGYRVYFVQRERVVVVLLCGGDKSSQKRDIAKAKRLAKEV